MPLVRSDGALAADIELREVHATQALDRYATELAQARDLLRDLTQCYELASQLREAPKLVEQFRQRARELLAELGDAVHAWKQSAELLTEATHQVSEVRILLDGLARLESIGPKLDRIEHVIDMLNRAEVLRWRQ